MSRAPHNCCISRGPHNGFESALEISHKATTQAALGTGCAATRGAILVHVKWASRRRCRTAGVITVSTQTLLRTPPSRFSSRQPSHAGYWACAKNAPAPGSAAGSAPAPGSAAASPRRGRAPRRAPAAGSPATGAGSPATGGPSFIFIMARGLRALLDLAEGHALATLPGTAPEWQWSWLDAPRPQCCAMSNDDWRSCAEAPLPDISFFFCRVARW